MMKKVLSALLTAAMLLSPTVSAAKAPGLTVTVPEGVTLNVYSGFAESDTPLDVTSVSTADGITTYFYEGLAAGNYHYKTTGAGYYRQWKSFVYSSSDASKGKTINVDPGKSVGEFEQVDPIRSYTDELTNAALPSSPDMWPEYADIFNTPYFLRDKSVYGRNQQTTQQEAMDFIRSLDGAGDNMYLFILGSSPAYGYEIPLIVFTKTDLSGASTLEEAAALVRANGKCTVHYQTMIHPNEPGSGEASLAMIRGLNGAYGDTLLDSINVYVLPRINADGARVWTRNNVAQGVDMNRDHLQLASKELTMIHHVYNLFQPEVALDEHEYTAKIVGTRYNLDDARIGTAGSLNTATAVNDLALDLLYNTFDAVSARNLRPCNYGDYATNVSCSIGRVYYGLCGSLSFLMETEGIDFGMGWYERRVVSHYVVAEAIFNYVAAHHDEVRATVAAGRQSVIDRGATYEEDDVVVLKSKVNKDTQTPYHLASRPLWDQPTGTIASDNGRDVYHHNEIVTSRPRPTAYVIPKGAEWAEQVADTLNKNAISYYELEPGDTALLRQYTGNDTAADLLDEASVTFEKGAYVFPMNQAQGNVLAMSLEPDVADASDYKGTLVQRGVIPVTGGALPIYRYVHDLEPDGKIALILPTAAPELTVVQPTSEFAAGKITGLDPARSYEMRAAWEDAYSPVTAGATEIADLTVGTYYVRFPAAGEDEASQSFVAEIVDAHATAFAVYVSDSGSDANDGRAQARPVKTFAAAYSKLAALMKTAPAGVTEGTVALVGTVTLNANTVLPDHDFPIVITGVNSSAGLSSAYNISFGGDTRLENMTLTQTASALRFLYGEGHRLELGEGLTCVPTGIYYYCVVAGGSSPVKGGTDLIIRSGTWRNVYASGYAQSVRGNARLTVTGGTITNMIATSYSGTTEGDVTIDLKNVPVGGNIYCGNTYSGSVIGNDVTLLLGQGVTVAKAIYGGSRDAGNVFSTVHLVLDGATVPSLNGNCVNTDGMVRHSVITLKKGACTGAVAADEIVLDTSAGGQVSLSGGFTAAKVVGGGSLRLPAGQTLTVTGTVTGSTELILSGTPESGALCVAANADVPASAFTSAATPLSARANATSRRWYVLTDAPGDMNGDDKVNAKDVVLLSRYVAGGYGVTLSDGAADLDCDGVVTVKDSVLLMRYIAGGYGATLD